MAKDKVWVCKKCKNAKCLSAFLKGSQGPRVKKVGCQKICKGPVAGVKVDGRMEWFARIDSAKPMVALARLSTRRGKPKLPAPLAQRRVGRRSGQAPR